MPWSLVLFLYFQFEFSSCVRVFEIFLTEDLY
ncbi:hypothetical protein Gotur_023351 [Gossypium turneri]